MRNQRYKQSGLLFNFILVWFLFSPIYMKAEPISFNNDDIVVFFGDSITEEGALKGGYVDIFKTTVLDKIPDKNIRVIGAGISGDKVDDLLERVKRDVLVHKPTIVVVYIGINDVWGFMGMQGTPPETYRAELRELVSGLLASGARVLLATLSVIGEKKSGNSSDERLEQFSKIVREVAHENSLAVVDLRSAFVEYLKANNKDDKADGMLTRDQVHLNAAGNLLVAKQMLSAFGL